MVQILSVKSVRKVQKTVNRLEGVREFLFFLFVLFAETMECILKLNNFLSFYYFSHFYGAHDFLAGVQFGYDKTVNTQIVYLIFKFFKIV